MYATAFFAAGIQQIQHKHICSGQYNSRKSQPQYESMSSSRKVSATRHSDSSDDECARTRPFAAQCTYKGQDVAMPSGTLESQLFGRGRGRKPKRPAPHHHPPRPAPAARAFVGGESMPPPNIAATEYAAAPSDASEGSSLVPTVAVAPDAASDPDRPPIKSTIGPGGAPALNRCDDTCNDAIWNNQFNDLRDFWERNGHFDVPTNWPQNSTLASWVNTQRTEYQSKQDGNTSNQPGIITQDQIDALNGLGFSWRKFTW